jgi:hypothetical protein
MAELAFLLRRRNAAPAVGRAGVQCMARIEHPPGTRRATSCRVSIIIKALNEERGIERAVENALNALEELGPAAGEVVLADSCSTASRSNW